VGRKARGPSCSEKREHYRVGGWGGAVMPKLKIKNGKPQGRNWTFRGGGEGSIDGIYLKSRVQESGNFPINLSERKANLGLLSCRRTGVV